VDELRDAGLPVGSIIVNQVREPLLSEQDQVRALDGELDAAHLAIDLESVGISPEPALIKALLEEAAAHAERVALERRERETIRALNRPTFELPFRPDGVDPGSLYDMAELLREQGVV
jgi:hypothetical protein